MPLGPDIRMVFKNNGLIPSAGPSLQDTQAKDKIVIKMGIIFTLRLTNSNRIIADFLYFH